MSEHIKLLFNLAIFIFLVLEMPNIRRGNLDEYKMLILALLVKKLHNLN
jgi:hypothetical protein